ncbi:hypothetical protein [Streptomyces hainanensis]|uniref:Uncharacterized protein n=1 Tax=Streptomyces hainanensis TaxID=402648 RepID=A0A4R4TKB4_9ACTN|nr:hypothetical protein [Streptomyces hainanensis]TDC74529.1 hypothetical protein E1283_15350 [Streptomyces hainanensis]
MTTPTTLDDRFRRLLLGDDLPTVDLDIDDGDHTWLVTDTDRYADSQTEYVASCTTLHDALLEGRRVVADALASQWVSLPEAAVEVAVTDEAEHVEAFVGDRGYLGVVR